jgi:hypothetical protein
MSFFQKEKEEKQRQYSPSSLSTIGTTPNLSGILLLIICDIGPAMKFKLAGWEKSTTRTRLKRFKPSVGRPPKVGWRS